MVPALAQALQRPPQVYSPLKPTLMIYLEALWSLALLVAIFFGYLLLVVTATSMRRLL